GPFAPLPETDANRWRAAIERLQREANALGEIQEAARIHLEIGRLHEEKLGQPRQAASAYQAAFNLDPRDPAILHASRRLFAEVGNWAMVVQILGHQISGAKSVNEQATLLAEKGAILEHELRNVEGAREAYEEALGLWPAEPQALAALERLHLFHKSHEALFEVYRRALDADLGPDRRLPLLLAAAQLAEDRLDDLDDAVELNEEALRLDQAHPVALASLRRLQQQRGDKRALLVALERSADVSGDEASVQHLAAAARLALDGLEDSDLAVSLLERARRRAPNHPGILRELALLHQRAGRDDALIEILRAAVPAASGRERATLLHRLGRALERNGDLSAAAAAEQDALRAERTYAPAAQALGRLLEKLDRPDALVELYNLEIDAEMDPEERVSRWFKLAVLLETRLNNLDAAADALRALLEIEPEYPPARKRLEHLLARKEAWGELVALHEEEVELTADNELKVFLLGRIGSLAEEKLDDPVRAKSAMQRLLELSPKHLGAIRSLSRIAERERDHPGLLRLLEVEAEATDDQAEVLALMQRRADLLARELGDREGAIAVLEQLLSLNPTYLPALRTLGRLHAEGGDWVELVQMHRRELEVTKSNRHRVDLLFRLAQLLEERLSDEEGAIESYELLLEVEPDNVAAARALAELYARRGEVEKLAEHRLGEAENIEGSAERCAALVEVAELYEERLDRSDKAADLYQRVLREGHDVDAATRALVRIYSREGMWNALVGALRTASDRASDPRTRAAVLLRSAQIHADKLKNLDASVELLEQAADLLPEDRAVLEQLERSSVARRDWPRTLEVGQRLAHLETDANARAARHLRLAAIQETQLEPPKSGAEQYRA
ncbi:MAG: tetratricopeptide repeat protein, partial [Myxococcota bacterium]